ncbi:MAG: protein kinase domain-containing protein [Thermoanaerobaculia bacterium]
MTAGFWDEVRELFHRASELPAHERDALLARADTDVREEVKSLLTAHDEPGEFLDQNVWQLIDANQAERLEGATIGPYRIVRQLGHGGMGTVFLATRDTEEFEQRVAIKLVRGGEALVQRFRKERKILAALDHPNIARLIDGGTTNDGLPYLVMEYVEGTPIDEYCRKCTIPEKLRLFLELCNAVQYAHQSLIIHRDIKPANVLVTADGTPKLLDFGIARLASPDTGPEAAGTRIMTPEYASPEQLLGRVVTTATDVYSLGLLLFEVLTGQQPFDSSTRMPDSEPPRPSVLAKSRALQGDLDGIVLAALEVDPARRYGSVEKLADDVRRHLSGHPINARRATFGYRTEKFLRRNKLSVGAGIVIAVVTILAFVVTLQQKRLAEERFDEVRSLARSVVFELHDAIAPLPGSTSARELLVRRALGYLDRLGKESAHNRPLQMELAGAYLKIGDVQGLPYSPNLGDTAGAKVSYEKALSLATAVFEDEPDDVAARALLADANDRLGLIEQRALHWPQALQRHEAARAIREALPRDAARDIALAQTWTAIGDCVYIGAKTIPPHLLHCTARQAYESALAIASRVPRNKDSLKQIARAHQRLGGYLSGAQDRDLPLALRHHEAALQALEQRSKLDPSDAMARRNWADQFIMKATAYNFMHDGASALAETQRGLDMLTQLATADPKNVEAQHDLAFAYGEQATAYRHLGRYREAEATYERAAAIYQKLLDEDPSNGEDRRDLRRLLGMLKEVQALRSAAVRGG